MSIIHSGNYYRFKSLADNKYLNILTYGNLKNNVNVTTFALNTRDDCQIWKCDPYSANGIEGFLMKSKRNENYVLDAYWGTSNLNNADIYSLMSTDNDVKDQLVVFMSYGDSYRIKLKYKNLYLTNAMSDTYEGHDVRWAPLSNTDNQLWRAEVVGTDPVTPVSTVPSAIANHTYLLRNKKSGLNLNVYGTNTVANNRNVTIYTKENVAAQKWKAVQTSGGPKLVTEINNAFALNINTNGNKCTMYTAAGNDYDSVLDFIHVSGNSYRIRIHNYSLYLTATGNERGDLVKWDSDMSDASVWEFVEEEDMFTTMTHAPDTLLNKTFFVRNMSTGLNLNVHGSDTVANSRNVNTYTRENCQAQRWTVQNTLAGAKIFTAINPSYALNIYGSNCTMYIARGNDNDSVIELVPYSLPEKIFRIRMYNHDKYLCATGTADGSNATWENYNSDGCLWQFVDEEEMFPPAGVVPRELVGKTLFVQAEGTDYNLNVHGTDTVANSTNVNLYRKENCLAQRWCARQDSAGPKLYTAIDSAFALNINTNNNNCTMYTAIGNDNDSVLDFERLGPMRYRIKLHNHNKYLYVDGDIATGTNVKWASSVSQATIWKFASPSEIEFDEIGEGSLDGAESYLVTSVIPADPSNFTPNRAAQGASISEICIHHTAGEMSVQALGSLWQRPTRAGSSHYGVHDNEVGQYVSERDIAWTNGHWESNCRSVTIETSNNVPYSQGDVRGWTVSSATLNTLIQLVADIARRNNLGTLVPGENLTWHNMYKATVCPGPYLRSQMDYIAQQANIINDNISLLRRHSTSEYLGVDTNGYIISVSKEHAYPFKLLTETDNSITIVDAYNSARTVKVDSSNRPILSLTSSLTEVKGIYDNNHLFLKVVSAQRTLMDRFIAFMSRVFIASDSDKEEIDKDDNSVILESNVAPDVVTNRFIRIKCNGKYLTTNGREITLEDADNSVNQIWSIKYEDDNSNNMYPHIVSMGHPSVVLGINSEYNTCSKCREEDIDNTRISVETRYASDMHAIQSDVFGKYLIYSNNELHWNGNKVYCWEFEEDPYIMVDGWLKLYYNKQYETATNSKEIDETFLNEVRQWTTTNIPTDKTYTFDNPRYWYSNELYDNPNKHTVTKLNGESVLSYINHGGYKILQDLLHRDPVINMGSNGECTDENGYYWVAVGPKVLYPDFPNTSTPGGEPNRPIYGEGTIDVEVTRNGNSYYIRCVVGDIKGHTWSNGYIQTWKGYPDGELWEDAPEEYEGVVPVEFIIDKNLNYSAYQQHLISLGNYCIKSIAFYHN